MWRLLLVAVVVAPCGCGRVGFDVSPAGGGDGPGGSIDSAPVDAPFGPPQKIMELSTAQDEDDPSLTDDMLEMFFDDNTTSAGLVHSTRSAVDQPWSPPVQVTELNTARVNNAKIAGDGLTIYFASTRAPAMGNDLWFATRPDRTSPFSAPQIIPGTQTAGSEIEPMALPGGKVLYFTSMGLWRAERPSATVAFGSPIPIPELDSGTYDGSMFVSSDERVVYFHSDRVSAAERAIYRASRANAGDPFGAPVRLTELDMTGKEEDPWLSPDGHVLYFSSNTSGQYDIYTATR